VARLTNELLAELLAIITSSKITGYKRIVEEREGRKLTLKEYVDKLVDLAHSYTLCEKEKKAIVERYAKLRSKLTNLSYHITKLKYT
jgi:methyltransferase-like protein